MVCLIESRPQVREQVQNLADKLGVDYSIAKVILQENNGYDLDKAPNGAESKLYKDLLDLFNGDERQALIAKAKTYLQPFFNRFGNWTNPDISKVNTFNIDAIDTSKVDIEEYDKPWKNDPTKSNKALRIYIKGQHEKGYFELVKDHEFGVFSVHFKTGNADTGEIYGSTKEERSILYKQLLNALPNGAQLSTWGELSDGGIKAINKLGETLQKIGERQVKDRKGNSISIPIYQKGEGASKIVDENGEPLIQHVTADNNVHHQNKSPLKRRANFTPEEHRLSDRMSSILRKLFPEMSVKYVDSIEGGYVGEADLDALEILIDKIASGLDTEPHEYAHYYVRMFFDSDLIQEGIRLFGSEEALVQAIGVRTVEMEAKARNWWQKFVDFIKNLLNNNKFYKQQLLAEITDSFLERRQLTIQQQDVSGKFHQEAQPTIEKVREAIFSNQAQIDFDPLTHSYTVKDTGDKLNSVTDMKKQALYDNYDQSVEDEIQAEISDEARSSGTSIHAVFESLINGTYSKSKFPQYTDSALNDIKQIYDRIIEQYDIVLSEAMLCDVEHKIAGTTDLLVRNKKTGKYEIIDFKTKMYQYNGDTKNKKGKTLWGFKFIDSKKFSLKSTRDGYDFQLTAYENMLKRLGVTIDKRSILPIVYSVKGDKIQKVMVSKIFGKTSTDKEGKNLAQEIERRSQTQYDVSYKIFGDKSNIKVSEQQLSDAMDDITDMVNKVVKRLQIQKELFKLRGRRSRNQLYEATKALEQIEGLTELDALLHFVNYAAQQLKRLNDQIEKRYRQGDDAQWNLDILMSYREVAKSYDNVGKISGIAHRYSELFGKENVKAIDSACSLLQQYQMNILSACDAIGKQLHIEAIAPYVGNVRQRMLDEYRTKYIKDNPRKSNESQEEYQKRVQDNVKKYEQEHEEEIQYQTKRWVRQQTEIAEKGFECSSLIANFGSVYQSKDPIVQATIMLFDREMNEQDRQLTVFRYKLDKAVKAFRNKYGVGNFSVLRDVFDDFIEIVGDTPYLVNELGGAYMQAEKEARDRIFKNPELTIKQQQEEFRKWLDENNPISDQEAFDEEVKGVLDQIFSEVDQKAKKAIQENLKLPHKDRKSWYVLMKEGVIGETVKDALDDIETVIEAKYRKPNSSLYPNEKYHKMMQLRDSNDPKFQLFQVLTEAIEQIDHRLPNSLKLKYRLPGIIKKGAERVGSDGLMSAISNKLQQNTMIMEDSDEVGTFVNEDGKKLNQVPLFYRFNPKITLDEQSFDLPTIFYKWYDSATTYLAKKRIEGHILQTQAILQQRETEDSTFSLLGNDKAKTSSHKTNTQNQFEGWVDQVFYGNKIQDMGSFKLPFTDKKVNVAKLIRSLIGFSSNRTMSMNIVSAINNLLMAEVNQWEEAFASTFITKENYIKAHQIFISNFKGMVEDSFNIVPNNQLNRLAEYFGIFDPGDNMMLRGFMRKSLNDYAYMATKIGDRQAQIKFLIAALLSTEAKDKDGKVIGNMFEMIKVNDDGELVVDERVDNFSTNDIDRFRIKLKRVLIDLHGNYDKKRSAVKAETAWYGAAGLALRRWIEPNYERRFVSEYYDNVTGTKRSGFISSSASWIFLRNPYMAATINFFLRNKKDADKYMIQAMKWDQLDDLTKSNIKRFTIEIGTAMLAYCLFALIGSSNADDDDEIMANVRYQMYRLYTDLTFFILPTSFTKILNEPFPVINVLTDVSDIVVQLFSPFEEYQTGKHLFDNKLLNKISRVVPGVKQIGRMGNISSEMEVFMRQR